LAQDAGVGRVMALATFAGACSTPPITGATRD